MLAQHIFHIYLVANSQRDLEFKMVVTLGLQDISSMYITLETSYVFILYVYYIRIKLTKFFASIDASTLAQYIFHVYLVVN